MPGNEAFFQAPDLQSGECAIYDQAGDIIFIGNVLPPEKGYLQRIDFQ